MVFSDYQNAYGRHDAFQRERNVFSINTRLWVKELKEMAAEGLVTRTAYATVPPTVE